MEQLRDKVAVITGAASGIGFALAERFAAEGMRLVLADVEAGALEAAADRLHGADSLAVPTDVASADSVLALAATALERFGAVHVVCNNAGVGGLGPMWDLRTWEWTVGVNLWGVVHGIHAFLPHLLAQGEGHIVNTASMAGVTVSVVPAAYVATKHAVVGLSERLFHEVAGTGVDVSVVCPGMVRTRIVDSQRNWPERLGPDPGMSDEHRVLTELFRATLEEVGLEPSAVADAVVDAVRARRFWVFPQPELADRAVERFRRAAAGENPASLF